MRQYDGAVVPFEDSADADADKEETADVTTDTDAETTEETAEQYGCGVLMNKL